MGSLQRSLVFCAISLCSLAQGNELFPKVDAAVQETRDADRRLILETELAAERQSLGAAREAMAKSPTNDARTEVHRHEENVEALRRELEHLPDGAPVRVGARRPGIPDAPASGRSTPVPAQAPFWDVYRRNASPVDFQPPAKELP